MVPVRELLLGPDRFQRSLDLLFAVAVFVSTLLAYGYDVFEVSGGVVFLPFDAAVVGLVGAATVVYRGGGLVFAWLVACAALLGYHAEEAVFEKAGDPFLDRLASFVQPDGLAYLGVMGVVIGTLGFVVVALLTLGRPLRDEYA